MSTTFALYFVLACFIGMFLFARKLMLTINSKNKKITALESKVDVLTERLQNAGRDDNNGA